MEEDIKILQDKDLFWKYPEKRILQAIENLINRNKELEEIKVRPCLVKNKKALFHKWVHTKNLLGQEFEVGIVEYENGQVEEVTPNNIKFCDNKMKEYRFEELK